MSISAVAIIIVIVSAAAAAAACGRQPPSGVPARPWASFGSAEGATTPWPGGPARAPSPTPEVTRAASGRSSTQRPPTSLRTEVHSGPSIPRLVYFRWK
eukprot:scaffold125518_cov47-Prasinocladus_malaysianus.AAC.1